MFDDDLEALELERFDADLEMAELTAAGDAAAAARAAGRCAHGSAVGYLPVPVYPEQVDLKPGQLRCTEGCQRVFADDDEWYGAMADA